MRCFGGSGCNADMFYTMLIGQRVQWKTEEQPKFGKINVCAAKFVYQ